MAFVLMAAVAIILRGISIRLTPIWQEKFFDNVPQDKLMGLAHNIISDGDT